MVPKKAVEQPLRHGGAGAGVPSVLGQVCSQQGLGDVPVPARHMRALLPPPAAAAGRPGGLPAVPAPSYGARRPYTAAYALNTGHSTMTVALLA